MSGAAFFDVDETLITVKSMFAFLRFWLAENGDDGTEYARATGEIKERAAGGLAREEVNRLYYRNFRGVRAEDLTASGQRWFEQFVAGGAAYYSDAVEALEAHRDSGDRVVFLSGSFAAAIAPVAAVLGADQVIATTPVTDENGVLTGEVWRPMIGAAKASAVTEFLREHDIAFENTYGYGDHASDLPFLEVVAQRAFRGDDPVLLARAAAEGWTHLSDRVAATPGAPGRILTEKEAVSVW
ncbi:HAD-IB family hydrolase [Nocardia yamanashiensis]|uniref:HAD family hydrolase n=1 Tax=Nocardia yamanashiensis TaxID=209247 RepID=UPI001E6533EE|nr:HAD-IB family hydrolase [Nocardia yamanashiensis]UGT42433.1 HAD-IB family hydrolase [Nocardia yamanashiensis]